MNASGEDQCDCRCAPCVAAWLVVLSCGCCTIGGGADDAAGSGRCRKSSRSTARQCRRRRCQRCEAPPATSAGSCSICRVWRCRWRVVLGLIFALAVGRASGFSRHGRAGEARGVVRVLSRTPVTPKQQVLLVQVGRRVLVVADNGTQMNPLSEITDPDEVAAAGGPDCQRRLPGARRRLAQLCRQAQEFRAGGRTDAMDASHGCRAQCADECTGRCRAAARSMD